MLAEYLGKYGFSVRTELASRYAGNIMQIYNQYRWRQSVMAQHGKPKWEGLEDDDTWQIQNPGHPNDFNKRRLRELDFWFGKPTLPATHPVVADDLTDTDGTEDNAPSRPKPTRRVATHATTRRPARAAARSR